MLFRSAPSSRSSPKQGFVHASFAFAAASYPHQQRANSPLKLSPTPTHRSSLASRSSRIFPARSRGPKVGSSLLAVCGAEDVVWEVEAEVLAWSKDI
mgnify:CR=1 FL=1